MNRKSVVVTAALLVGLALGVVAAPAIQGGIASAQTKPTAQPASGFANLRNMFLDKLAAALHVQRPALDTAIKDAGNGTLDDAVKQGQLTQQQADQLKQRVQQGETPFWGGRGGDFGGKGMFSVMQPMIEAAAKTVNLTPQQLMTQLKSGQTLAQIAQAHNTTEQAVINAALAAAKTQLDQAVTKGTLTKTQADQIYARLQQAGAQLFGRNGGFRHRGEGQGQNAPATPQQAPNKGQGL